MRRALRERKEEDPAGLWETSPLASVPEHSTSWLSLQDGGGESNE